MSHKKEQLALLLAYKLLQEVAALKSQSAAAPDIRERAQAVLKHYPLPIKINLLYESLNGGK